MKVIFFEKRDLFKSFNLSTDKNSEKKLESLSEKFNSDQDIKFKQKNTYNLRLQFAVLCVEQFCNNPFVH